VIEFSAGHPGWAAGIALGAAAVTSWGTALQQRAAQATARESGRASVLVRLVHDPGWLFSLVLIVAGFGLYLLALSLSTLILAQPLMLSGVVFGSLFSARLARRRLDRAILAGAMLCGLGLALFLAAARPVAPLDGPGLSGPRWPMAAAAAIALVAGAAGAATRGLVRSMSLAAATGLLFGLNAAFAKLIAGQLGQGWTEPVRHWPLYVMAVAAPTGFVLSQQAMRFSRLLAPVNAVISSLDPLTAVAIGALTFGERIRTGPADLLGEVAAGLLLAAGILLVTRRSATLHSEHRRARTETDIAALSWG
jgi:drug/metabolite transporter (DMT)-like permease